MVKRKHNMVRNHLSWINPDPPNSRPLRLSFHLLWAVDMCTAVLLILVPYAEELNPVTVFFYELFGFPGVAIAACFYAAIIIGVGHFLSHPVDLLFIIAVVGLYFLFVFNNVLLLAFDYTIAELFQLRLSSLETPSVAG